MIIIFKYLQLSIMVALQLDTCTKHSVQSNIEMVSLIKEEIIMEDYIYHT